MKRNKKTTGELRLSIQLIHSAIYEIITKQRDRWNNIKVAHKLYQVLRQITFEPNMTVESYNHPWTEKRKKHSILSAFFV